MHLRILCVAIALAAGLSVATSGQSTDTSQAHETALAASSKPLITIDEYFNTTEVISSALSPDGASAVIGTETPDWKNSIFRHDLWLWTATGGLKSLTHSGSE